MINPGRTGDKMEIDDFESNLWEIQLATRYFMQIAENAKCGKCNFLQKL